MFKFSKKSTIDTVMTKLNKKDQKIISNILYRNKLCNLSEYIYNYSSKHPNFNADGSVILFSIHSDLGIQ